MRKALASALLIITLTLPLAASAETTANLQAQLIAALQELIKVLTAEVALLQQQIAAAHQATNTTTTTQCPTYTTPVCPTGTSPASQGYDAHGCALPPACKPPVSSLITTPHICTPIPPPSCTTQLTATYDTSGCVTGYACQPGQTTATSQTDTSKTTGASCIVQRRCHPNIVVPNGATAGGGFCGGQCILQSYVCSNGTLSFTGNSETSWQYDIGQEYCPGDVLYQ